MSDRELRIAEAVRDAAANLIRKRMADRENNMAEYDADAIMFELDIAAIISAVDSRS